MRQWASLASKICPSVSHSQKPSTGVSTSNSVLRSRCVSSSRYCLRRVISWMPIWSSVVHRAHLILLGQTLPPKAYCHQYEDNVFLHYIIWFFQCISAADIRHSVPNPALQLATEDFCQSRSRVHSLTFEQVPRWHPASCHPPKRVPGLSAKAWTCRGKAYMLILRQVLCRRG